MEVVNSQIINEHDIQTNRGQIPGLPRNPRIIRDERFEALKRSITENPEMMSYREILVYPFHGKYVIIGGNMRFAALKDLGIEEIPCKVIPATATVNQLKAYTVKDNNSFGEWSFDEESWSQDELKGWGLTDEETAATHTRRKTIGWGKSHNGEEHRCNLKETRGLYEHYGALVFTIYRRTETGYLLDDIKSTGTHAERFADDALNFINKVIGSQNHQDIAVITTPKRRHKENNFAEDVAHRIAQKGGFVFYPDAVIALNRDRIKPKFQCQADIREKMVIIYDDIITTGKTIMATGELFPDKNKLYVASINNK